MSQDTTNKKLFNLAAENFGTDPNFKHEIKWIPNVALYIVSHCLAFYGIYLMVTAAQGKTHIYSFILMLLNGQSVSLGAHRLYSHKSFKASYFLRLVIMYFFTASGQDCMFVWARDHRLHHKYSETDADPHNSRRGFFFCHAGWLLTKKHPLAIQKGREIDMTDITADPIAMFQKKHYKILHISIMLLQVAIPMYFWNEPFKVAFMCCYVVVTVAMFQVSSTGTSVAHLYGTRPFDKNIAAVDTLLVTLLTSGEGFHNYHHCFPYDYRSSEFGARFNNTAKVIEFLAYLGLASELKLAPESSVKHKIIKHGDGSHPIYGKIEYDPEMTKNLTRGFDIVTKKRK